VTRALPVLLALLGAAAVALAAPPSAPERSAATAAAAQANGNVPYDGRFTFVRLRFATPGEGYLGYTPPWAHDYPRAERNLMNIVRETTLLAPYLGGGNILTADDPELHKFPIAYISEPGYWKQSEREVKGLREYLLKGGFLIVDDFRGGDLYNFQDEIRRVLPEAELVELNVSHPIFHAFFEVESLEHIAPTFRRFRPVYYGIFEDNDRAGRLLAVVNYNNDIGDFWEFSDVGWFPVELSNEAYKLGVNYILYAMTH
jgi:hypothetical protein